MAEMKTQQEAAANLGTSAKDKVGLPIEEGKNQKIDFGALMK